MEDIEDMYVSMHVVNKWAQCTTTMEVQMFADKEVRVVALNGDDDDREPIRWCQLKAFVSTDYTDISAFESASAETLQVFDKPPR